MHMGGPDALRHRPIVTTNARYRAAQMDYCVGSTDLAARPAALTMKPCRRTSLGGSGRHDHAFLGGREQLAESPIIATPPPAVPLGALRRKHAVPDHRGREHEHGTKP